MQKLTEILDLHGIEDNLEHVDTIAEEPMYRLPNGDTPPFTRWQTLRDLFDQTGFWPLLFDYGTPVITNTFKGRLPAAASDEAHAILTQVSQQVEPPFTQHPDADWFTAELEAVATERRTYTELFGADSLDDPWRITDPTYDLETIIAASVLLVPVQLSWHVLAVLGYVGGSLDTSYHTECLKYWSEQYGAEVVCLDGATIIFRATRPPIDRTSALRLAWELRTYCPDLQVTPLDTFAGQLLRGEPWNIWWD
jgi:hypothetical protein